MTVLPPKIPQHEELIRSINTYLSDPNNSSLPSLGSGRMEFQLYKAALVMDTFLSRLEEIIEETKGKATERGIPVTCSKGCDACCSQPISGSFFEGVLISLYLESNLSLKEQFLNKYTHWRSSIGNPKEYDQTVQLGMINPNHSALVRKAVDNFNQGQEISCPFLEEHCCSIYPARPTACRQLLSVDNPLKCQTGEQARLLRAGNIDQLLYGKLTPLLNHLGKSVGFPGIIYSLVPITVHEFLIYKEQYVEQVIRDVSGRMMMNPQLYHA